MPTPPKTPAALKRAHTPNGPARTNVGRNVDMGAGLTLFDDLEGEQVFPAASYESPAAKRPKNHCTPQEALYAAAAATRAAGLVGALPVMPLLGTQGIFAPNAAAEYDWSVSDDASLFGLASPITVTTEDTDASFPSTWSSLPSSGLSTPNERADYIVDPEELIDALVQLQGTPVLPRNPESTDDEASVSPGSRA
jgi:hypothetical protein